MSKQKKSTPPVSEEDNAQVQHLLGQFHEIANKLHTSISQSQAQAALSDINSLSEAAQVALLKALPKEHSTDAADVLIAVNELSPIKSVRKEARRSLIRMEGARIYPRWQPPIDRTPVISTVQAEVDNATTPFIDLFEELEEEKYPVDIVDDFLEAWSEGDYGSAYDLLASDSDLREGLSREEWIERRTSWAEEARPANFISYFTRERTSGEAESQSSPPSPGDKAVDRQEVEASWSLELLDTPPTRMIKEIPLATAVYKETGTHWYWTSYVLVREQNEWRIQSMKDEGTNAQSLPLEELQRRIEKLDKKLKEKTQEEPEETNLGEIEDWDDYLMEPFEVAAEVLHYDDALIAQEPGNSDNYELASNHAEAAQEFERACVYLEQMAQRFPERRAAALQKLALTQLNLSEQYHEIGEDERGDTFLTLTLANLRESLKVENTLLGHLTLANLLIEEEDFDEAEEHFQQANTLATEDSQKTSIGTGLGTIALERRQYEQALQHFEQVAKIDPAFPQIWYNIGKAQYELGNSEDARASFERALELDPNDYRLYTLLGKIYVDNTQWPQAREILEQGLRVNPYSAELRGYLSLMWLAKGDRRRAEKLLREAEEIDPELELIPTVRLALNQLPQRKPVESKSKQKSKSKHKKR